METKAGPTRVAVIGLGIAGVGALKNLREVGLDAVGFERNSYIGGLWQWTPDPGQTSVLRSTVANISRQRNCYTDFPWTPDDAPDYPTAEQIEQYINAYADHFRLRPHCRLETAVERIVRAADGHGWVVRSRAQGAGSTTEERFEKVLVTTGTYSKPFMPTLKGVEHFKGQILHSQAFKGPSDFTQKRVVIVGMSNTGCDAAVDLCKTASKVYISHRSGARILTRQTKSGKPVDHQGTRRLSGLGLGLAHAFPRLAGKLAAIALEKQMKGRPGYSEEWKLLPAGPIPHASPVANDHLLDRLADGSLTSVAGIRRFHDDGATVELDDGACLADVEAVICCTGYRYDFSIAADPAADPTSPPTPEWDRAKHSNAMAYPRLYMGLFSTAFPNSLAFLGAYRGPSASAFTGFDLKSQAIAQVWTGRYALPSAAEIERWGDAQYRYMLGEVAVWRIHKHGLPPGDMERWLNAAAGNGVNERLGWWSLAAWQFWWSDRRLYSAIMDGVDTPFVYRLFDGRRPKWDGAREAIMRTSERLK